MDHSLEKNPATASSGTSDGLPASFTNPFESNDPHKISSLSRVKQIWAVGGGKGGVGKSMITSNLAITLTRMGYQVTAVDLDLGGANLHTSLGVDLPKQCLTDFISGRVNDLRACVVPTGIPNLHLISGAQDAVGIANIPQDHKHLLISQLRKLDADFVLVDLGAGTPLHTLDFFIHCDVGFVTLLPEPTSIENAYRFIKGIYFRSLAVAPELAPVKHLIELAGDPKNVYGLRTPSDLFREINRINPECGIAFKRILERTQPKLVLNQARTQTDIDIGHSVKSVCKKYFGIDLDYTGFLDYDSSVWQAVRRKRPLVIEFPNSKLVSSFEKIANQVLRKPKAPY